MAAAAAAMAVPPIPTKWMEVMGVENIGAKLTSNAPGHNQFSWLRAATNSGAGATDPGWRRNMCKIQKSKAKIQGNIKSQTSSIRCQRLLWSGRGWAVRSPGAAAEAAPYRHLAGAYRRFPDLLYRRFPNRQAVQNVGRARQANGRWVGKPAIRHFSPFTVAQFLQNGRTFNAKTGISNAKGHGKTGFGGVGPRRNPKRGISTLISPVFFAPLRLCAFALKPLFGGFRSPKNLAEDWGTQKWAANKLAKCGGCFKLGDHVFNMYMNRFAAILATQAASGQPAPNPLLQFLPMVLIVVVFYFILIRPQQKQAKKQAELLKTIKAGDRVGTAAGIIGVVVSVKDNTVMLRTADSKLEVTKASVTTILNNDTPSAS
jgi:preprotein translocase subunit YajC